MDVLQRAARICHARVKISTEHFSSYALKKDRCNSVAFHKIVFVSFSVAVTFLFYDL